MNATGRQKLPNGGNLSDDPATTAITPEDLDQQTVAESPLPPPTGGVRRQQDIGTRMAEPEESRDCGISRHVSSSSDKEEVHVILHGVTNLPATTDSRPPVAFAAVKTKSSDDLNSRAEFVTSFHPTPSFSTSWETFGIVSVDERRSAEEVLIFKVMDVTSKQVLARYHLPLNYLQPFHPYHLEMVMPSVSSSQGVLLFASITRKLSFIPKVNVSPKYLGIEMLLQRVNEEFDQPVGPVTAAARVISSYYPYGDDALFSNHHHHHHYLDWNHVFGVSAKTIIFPNPHRSLFMPPASYMAGSPQVTLPGEPEGSPRWNHCFLFGDDRDSATLFNPRCALLVEFYRSRATMTELGWRLTSPLGYCVIPIDHDLYRSLTPSVTKGATAVRIEALPIQKCPLLTVDKKKATISLVLRLVNSQRPGCLKDLAVLDDLPVISVNQQLMSSRMDFPSHDAMEDILLPKQPTTSNKKTLEDNRAISAELKRDDSDDRLDPVSILDFQLKELNAYRDAIGRMERDIVSLHEQVRLLQTTNDKLRRQLETGARTSRTPTGGGSSGARRIPAEVKENDGAKKRSRKDDAESTTEDVALWDKNELEEKCDLMMKRVNRQSQELKEYREKVLKLQNELIQKNEKEKELLRKNVGDNSFRELEKQVQARTAKIRGLEEAYRNQEKIIDKMEKLLETKHKGDKDVEDVKSKIIEENKRLRLENQMLTEQNRLATKNRKDEEEMQQLRQKLETDAERIRTLEQKMVENARRWAHEKTDLQTRLDEAEHGFRRTSVLDRPPRAFATQQNWPPGADAAPPSPTNEAKLKQNKSSKRLPSIYT